MTNLMPVAVAVEMVYTTCAACGVCFGVPATYDREKRHTGKHFFCPNGHSLIYGSENEKLKAELKQAQAEKWQAVHELSTIKAKAEKLEKRIANGVCPCCQRSFMNLKRHLKSKHPQWAGAHHAS